MLGVGVGCCIAYIQYSTNECTGGTCKEILFVMKEENVDTCSDLINES